MRWLTFLFLGAALWGQTTIPGGGFSGTGTVGARNQGPPLPTITTFTASNLTPNQGTTITLTYAATLFATCTIDNGILGVSFFCNGTTSPFTPPFSAPGPTCTTYTFTVTNASGVVQSTQQVCSIGSTPSGDDSRYSTGTAENCAYPGGVTTDGPSTLPTVCLDTKLADTPSPGTVYGVGCTTSNCSGGAYSPVNCTLANWNAAVASVIADGPSSGDIIKVSMGCAITCSSTGCLLPAVRGNFPHWTLVETVDPATGNIPAAFPAEGTRVTPCAAGVASVTGRPSYPCPSPVNLMAKFISTSTTAAALTVYQIGAVSETCNVSLYPCASYLRLIGIEATNTPGTRTSHKLVELSGADHVIFDRGYVHGQDDPNFRVEVQGGILINGSHASVINSWVDQIVCANAPVGTTCVDSNGIFWSAGQYPEIGHKVVNNFIAASGEGVFTGGAGTAYFPTATNPDGGASDDEVRRNQLYHPLPWFLPYQIPAMTVASVDTAGNYTGTFLGGANNAFVGRTFKIAGFVNGANNIAAPGAVATGSTNTTLSFGTVTLTESHAATATNAEPHWDTKNLGESKGSNRQLWEGNVAEYSTIGFQSDQAGFGWLATPKSQDKPVQEPGALFTGSTSGGNFFITCTVSGGGSCSGAGKPGFSCDMDPNAIPDWTGVGTTVANCGAMIAFPCAGGTAQLGPFAITSVNGAGVYTGTFTGGAANGLAGWSVIITGFTNAANGSNVSPNTALIISSTATTITTSEATVIESASANAVSISNPSCPGAYAKACASKGDISHCALVTPAAFTGTYYHILHVVTQDQVQVIENSTSLVNVAGEAVARSANPFAAQRNWTARYNIIRHVGNCFQLASAQGDWGSNAKGVHNTSMHDNLCYDVNPGFFTNATGGCCTAGEAMELLSGTTDPTVVPSNIAFFHNTTPVIGYSSSSASGLLYFVDTRCTPQYNSGTGLCGNGGKPAYVAGLTIRDNIAAASLHITGNGSSFTPNTQANTVPIFGCAVPQVSGCTYDVQKNLLVTGIWSGQTNELPNLHLINNLPSPPGIPNNLEACSCTTVANGGFCTPGSPNQWASGHELAGSGTLDSCDRNPTSQGSIISPISASGYASIFNNWDPNGGATLDLQLPSNSPYKLQASDGTDLGANVATVLTLTAGVALTTPITQIAINGFTGNTGCNDISPCALPATTASPYGVTLSRTTPNGPFTQWTVTSGSLPAGFTLSLGTGILSGTRSATNPCGPGTVLGCTASFSAGAQDGSHSFDQQAFTITVN